MWNEPSKERLSRIPKLYATEETPLEEKLIITGKQAHRRRQKLKTLFLFCPDGQEILMDQLIDEFGTRAKDLGAILKMVEFKDL